MRLSRHSLCFLKALAATDPSMVDGREGVLLNERQTLSLGVSHMHNMVS
jgi:hypothetical protein